MMTSWRSNALQYSFYSLILLAVMLPLTETGTDIAYILAAFFALISGVVWVRRGDLVRHPINAYLLVLLIMMISGLAYSSGFGDKKHMVVIKELLVDFINTLVVVGDTKVRATHNIIECFFMGCCVGSCGELLQYDWRRTFFLRS